MADAEKAPSAPPSSPPIDVENLPPVPPPPRPPTPIPSYQQKGNSDSDSDDSEGGERWALALDTGSGTRMNMVVFLNLPRKGKKIVKDAAIRKIMFKLNKNTIRLEVLKKEEDQNRVLVLGDAAKIHKLLLDFFIKQEIEVDTRSIAMVPHIIMRDEDQLITDLKGTINLMKDWIMY